MSRRVLCTLMLLATSLTLLSADASQSTSAPTQDTSQSSAQSKGKTIGTIISAAVDTAFPVVGKILDLFKTKPAPSAPPPDKKNKVTPPPPEKTATESEVQAAVDQAKRQFITTFKQQIQPAASVAKELNIIETFATGAVSASENISNINHYLAASSPNFDDIDTEWTIAKNYLADAIAIKDFEPISDNLIKLRLTEIQTSRKDLMVRIDKNIALGKAHKSVVKADLQAQVLAMAGLLKGLNSLAAIELASLQSDIDNLAKWANSAAGGPSTFKPNSELIKVTDDAIQASKSTIQQTPIPQQ